MYFLEMPGVLIGGKFVGSGTLGVMRSVAKIGFTKNRPESRFKQVQNGCPFPLRIRAYVKAVRAKNLEHLCHLQCDDRRIRRRSEWYNISFDEFRDRMKEYAIFCDLYAA